MRNGFRSKNNPENIPQKANRILNLILVAFILIGLRIWHLSVIQHEEKVEEAKKPQKRAVIEAAKRGSIRDRFNIPLAINKVQYKVGVIYSQFRQIPLVVWETDETGKKIKKMKRREYITELSQLLAKELSLDSAKLEDLIHSKAALYYQLPFIIKEDLTEKEYYRLSMLSKDWVGIHVQMHPKRHYPLGKTASDIIGYMGSINREEYEAIIREMKDLEEFLQASERGEELPLPDGMDSPTAVFNRLQDLKEHAYTVSDYVGKAGIEARFEEDLRGFHGEKKYASDARGNHLKPIENSRSPIPGRRILLTISAELQEYAEKLLIENEKLRSPHVSGVDRLTQELLAFRQPWIKGGAIVAMDPNNGDVLALASHPRFNPNDFIFSGNQDISKQQKENVSRWFETEKYIADIWDQKRPLERECYNEEQDSFYDETKLLTWDAYIDSILPAGNAVRKVFQQRITTLGRAVDLQLAVDELLKISGQNNLYALFNEIYQGEEHVPYGNKLGARAHDNIKKHLEENKNSIDRLKKIIDRYLLDIEHNFDKVLTIDLCRIAVPSHLFSRNLRKTAGSQRISDFRNITCAKVVCEEVVKQMAMELFHEEDFKNWRQNNEKAFLKEKRLEEKAKRTWARPYIDYLDKEEATQFGHFWNANKLSLLSSFLLGKAFKENEYHSDDPLTFYHNYFSTWHEELSKGAHAKLPWREAHQLLSKAASTLHMELVSEYLNTLRSYSSLNRPLHGKYRSIRGDKKNPLEKNLAAAFYPLYGFGYARSHAFRQATPHGSIFKLVTGYEALIQHHKKIQNTGASSSKLNPLEIIDVVQKQGESVIVGYHLNGSPIYQSYKGGRVPKSLSRNIGKLDFLKAFETSSNPYFALLAGDCLEHPDDLARCAREFSYGSRTGIDLPAEIAGRVPNDLSVNRSGLYATAIGQHSLVVTPLQAAVMLSTIANGGKVLKPKIVNLMVGKPPARSQINSFENNIIYKQPTTTVREIFMPTIVRNTLLEGLERVMQRLQAPTLAAISQYSNGGADTTENFNFIKTDLVGKTSTAEAMETIDLDRSYGTNIYNHVWFGGILFDKDKERQSFIFRDKFGKPKLVVIVYLRFGGYGRDAAPIAGQIACKWRDICKSKNAH